MSRRPEFQAPPEIVGTKGNTLHLYLTSSFDSITAMQKPKNIHQSSSSVLRRDLHWLTNCPGSTRNQQIQRDMTYRALELLNLPPDQPAYLLDIGCGSGLSGEILDEEGFIWAGVDIAPSMLGVQFHTVSGCD